MDLVLALPLPATNNPERLLSLGAADLDAAVADNHHKNAGTAHFADILGQTLAGPLFAIWTPTPDIVASNKPNASQTAMAALDPNGRREGRKRSRR